MIRCLWQRAGLECAATIRWAGLLFSFVDLEKRGRTDRPLRIIKGVANATPIGLPPVFDARYSLNGRETIPPERLLGALLLQATRSARNSAM